MSGRGQIQVRSAQAPRAVLMVRPHHFTPNPQTAADNAFQGTARSEASKVADTARGEVDRAAQTLSKHGVVVHVVDDETAATPDSVFPNNWFSTHAGGGAAIYPMYAENRRGERRTDVIDMLKAKYRMRRVIDYSGYEADAVFLEGTGAMVLDHLARVAYVARSRRADDALVHRFCADFAYEPVLFDTADDSGKPIYHTNVMMCIGTHFALVCTDLIPDPHDADRVTRRLAASGKDVIKLTRRQIGEFAGNALELSARDGLITALSARAHKALTSEQKAAISASSTLVPLEVPTIELAGGSVRCMLAGIHLSPRH